MDSLRSIHGIVYVIFYGSMIKYLNFQDFWEFGTCTDSVYQALLSPHEREPGFEAKTQGVHTGNTMYMYELSL